MQSSPSHWCSASLHRKSQLPSPIELSSQRGMQSHPSQPFCSFTPSHKQGFLTTLDRTPLHSRLHPTGSPQSCKSSHSFRLLSNSACKSLHSRLRPIATLQCCTLDHKRHFKAKSAGTAVYNPLHPTGSPHCCMAYHNNRFQSKAQDILACIHLRFGPAGRLACSRLCQTEFLQRCRQDRTSRLRPSAVAGRHTIAPIEIVFWGNCSLGCKSNCLAAKGRSRSRFAVGRSRPSRSSHTAARFSYYLGRIGWPFEQQNVHTF